MLDYCHSNPVSAKDLPPKQCFVGAAYQFLKLMLCYFQAQFECQRAFYCHTALICIHRTVGTLNIFVIYIIKKCEASTNIAKGDCFDTFALSVKVISKAEIIIAHSSVVATLVSISSSRTAQPFTFSVSQTQCLRFGFLQMTSFWMFNSVSAALSFVVKYELMQLAIYNTSQQTWTFFFVVLID